jgi:hypothetical protein
MLLHDLWISARSATTMPGVLAMAVDADPRMLVPEKWLSETRW